MSHRIERLFLGNWMSFSAAAIPVRNLTTFLNGHNGSGKTTLFDAISLIYYGEDFSMLNYTGEKRRHAAGAIHWQTPNGILRPGNTNSYIIMESKDSNGRVYHQGIYMYSAAGSGKVDKKVYFQGEGTLESIGAMSYENVCNGRITMKQVFQSREKAYEAFFARRGYPVDTFIRAQFQNARADTRFRRMNRAILSNTGIGGKSLSEYAKENIFPAASTGESVEKIKGYQYELDRLSLAARQLEEKAELLEKLIKKGEENVDAIRASESFERAAANINYEHYKNEVERLEGAVREYEDLILDADKRAGDLEEKANSLRDQRSRLSQQETPVTRLRQEVKNKEAVLSNAQMRLQWHKRFLEAEEALIGKLPDPFMIDRVDDVLAELEKEAENRKNRYNEDRLAHAEVTDRIQTLRAALGGGEFGRSGPLAEMIQSASLLKEKIMEAMPEAEPRFLYECIESVKDPEWQEAVERLLGDDRFGIIVSGDCYREACGIQHDIRGNKRKVIVLNTEREAGEAARGTVPSVLEFNDPRAEQYIVSAYGRYVLCDTAEEYGRAKYALRRNGQTKVPNRSVLHGSAQRITKILGKEAIRREIERLIIQERDLDAREACSLADYEAVRRNRADIEKLNAAYVSLQEHNDPAAEKEVRKTEEEIAELNRQIELFSESEENRKREEELNRLSREISEVDRERTAVLQEGAGFRNRKEDREKDLADNTRSFARMLDAVKRFGELTEEDRRTIERNGWNRTLIGDAQVNNTRKAVTERKEFAGNALRDEFRIGRDIVTSMAGAPMMIENTQQLDWFKEEAGRVAEVRMDKSSLQQIERLRETLQHQFAGLLHSMHQDYVKAQEIRAKFNSFLPKYRIGICYYRLGPIRIRHNSEDARLMELAEKQERGEQLSQDDIEYINRVFEKMIRSAEHGVITNPFDYRQYITTSMEYRTDKEEDKWKNADRTSSDNSNGQQTILRYIVKIVVLASQAFTEKSLRLCITDEVLQGVDDTNAAYFFDALEEMNIQCILGSMDPRFAAYADDGFIFRMEEEKYTRITPFGNRKTNRKKTQEPA